MTTHILNGESITVVGNTLKCYTNSWVSLALKSKTGKLKRTTLYLTLAE